MATRVTSTTDILLGRSSTFQIKEDAVTRSVISVIHVVGASMHAANAAAPTLWILKNRDSSETRSIK